jgi:hypothetical protein
VTTTCTYDGGCPQEFTCDNCEALGCESCIKKGWMGCDHKVCADCLDLFRTCPACADARGAERDENYALERRHAR